MSGTARRFRRRSNVLILTEDVPDDATPRAKEGIARRRLVATIGRCPCGAVLKLPPVVPGTVTMVSVEHEPTCPATLTW